MEQPPGGNPDGPGAGAPDKGAERAPGLSPRIYAASLADYNAGRLHGRWLDAAREPEELEADIAAMLAASREPVAEDWAIHDYDGFGPLRLGEYEDLGTVSRLARGIAEHGEAFAAWASLVGHEADALDRFDEAYLGQWPSVAAYAEHLFDDLGYAAALDAAIPDFIRLYVRLDADALARDLQLGGDVTAAGAPDGGVWLFDANG